MAWLRPSHNHLKSLAKLSDQQPNFRRRKVQTMAELNVPQSMENGNSIEQPDSSSLRAVSKAAGHLERYKARVLQMYAHHTPKQICEILKREDRIIVR
jgi:hypothetical protein